MASPTSEGLLDFTYQGERLQTYYKVFGDLYKGTHHPLVVLHGGPGLIHDYLTNISALNTHYGIPIIFYDQTGNGRSTHLKDKPPSFWTIDLFIDELVNLLKYFSVDDNFSICGHSWGGILALEFELRRRPQGLKHLVLADSLASSALWNKSNMELMQKFPQDVQLGLRGGMKQPGPFFEALLKFHAVHGCTIQPPPEAYMKTLNQVFGEDGDPTVASAP